MQRRWITLLAITASLALRAQNDEYCLPIVDIANSQGSGITYVHLNGTTEISHTSPVGQGYFFANDSATLMVGGYYTLTITRTSGWGCVNNNLRAYIDFNGDHTFTETTETVALLY